MFDVKMDFTRKARWVKDGHHTPDPDQSKTAGFTRFIRPIELNEVEELSN